MTIDALTPVLVVDDHATTVHILRNLLSQIGLINVDDASEGAAALTKMRAKRYGLVISDWNMAPMTGYDFLREVRGDPRLKQTPFIVVTADSRAQSVITARKAGANNYIIKPFDAQKLKAKIESVFAAAKLLAIRNDPAHSG